MGNICQTEAKRTLRFLQQEMVVKGLTQFLLYLFEEVDFSPNCVQFQSHPLSQQNPTLFNMILSFKNIIITEPAF